MVPVSEALSAYPVSSGMSYPTSWIVVKMRATLPPSCSTVVIKESCPVVPS